MKKISLLLILFFIFSLSACSFQNGTDSGGNNNDINSLDIESVRIFTQPSKNFYSIGEVLLTDGGTIEITRKNGDTEVISLSNENVTITCPNRFVYWTENQRIGVKYHDPKTSKDTEEIYFGVRVGIDNNKNVSGYTAWKNDFLYLFYPNNYEAKPNNGVVIDYTQNIVMFEQTDFLSNLLGTAKGISLRQANKSTLLNDLAKSISELDSFYSNIYQSEYRKSYNDNSLQVSVTHQGISSEEYTALQHFQRKRTLYQVITISKTGTFLGLGNWTQRIDRYIIEGDGWALDVAFFANNSTFDKEIIKTILSNLHIKYEVAHTDA